MANAAHHVQHLFYADSSDPRIFQTGVVTPRRIVQTQRHRQSGNRYPPTVTNQSEWAEVEVETAFDLGDMVYILASLFDWQRDANGVWRFLSLSGARVPGYKRPKQWHKLLSYNWVGPASGPSYEAAGAILQSMELNFSRRDQTTVTAVFAAKEYQQIAQPPTAPVPRAVDAQVIRNSDIRIGLSAGRLGEVVYPTQVLAARWSFNDWVELIFGANQSDRGWTDFADATVQPTLRFRFAADEEYLKYANVDANTFVTFGDAAGTFEWIHLARFVDAPAGPGERRNLQEVEIAFSPYARVDTRALQDSVFTFTAARGAGADTNLYGYRQTAAIGSALTATAGYRPQGLTEILFDTDTDRLQVGAPDAHNRDWPQNWEPDAIRIGSGAVLPLAWDSGDRRWRTVAALNANPLTAGAATATLTWKWTPAHYMRGMLAGTGIADL